MACLYRVAHDMASQVKHEDTLWAVHKDSVGSPWAVSPWAVHGQFIDLLPDSPRAVHGYRMGSPWAPHAHSMCCSWAVHGPRRLYTTHVMGNIQLNLLYYVSRIPPRVS